MNFNYWYNQVADMPELSGGVWIDLETGIPYSAYLAAASAAKRGPRKPTALEINGRAAKVAEGLEYARRNAANQTKALARNQERFADHPALAAYVLAACAAIDATAALGEKPRKIEIAAAIRLNQAASRAANELK